MKIAIPSESETLCVANASPMAMSAGIILVQLAVLFGDKKFWAAAKVAARITIAPNAMRIRFESVCMLSEYLKDWKFTNFRHKNLKKSF